MYICTRIIVWYECMTYSIIHKLLHLHQFLEKKERERESRVYTQPGKVMESENRPKSQGIVMENHENLKKTWKSHGTCHPVKN
jgi:hypothetical protein